VLALLTASHSPASTTNPDPPDSPSRALGPKGQPDDEVGP
jgi:hypothetical protein